MRPSSPRRSVALVPVVLLATLLLASACGSGETASTASPTGSTRVVLGTNNPSQGDCTTNVEESATSVGYALLTVTPSSFEAQVELQSGPPNTTYAVFLQQVPGSCPQQAANGGTLVTNATGHGQVTTSVPRVAGATTFFVQLVPAGSGPPDYTSDRISAGS